jgi:hypothetical protein
MQVLQEKWALKYFFVKFKQKAHFLIYKEMIEVMENYNLQRHYNTKHASIYSDLEGHTSILNTTGDYSSILSKQVTTVLF